MVIKQLSSLFLKKFIIRLKKNNININVFGYENKQTFLIYLSLENFENPWLGDEDKSKGDKSHYVYIKYINRFMYHKIKHKNKQHFRMSCLQCFISEEILTNHKKFCIKITEW